MGETLEAGSGTCWREVEVRYYGAGNIELRDNGHSREFKSDETFWCYCRTNRILPAIFMYARSLGNVLATRVKLAQIARSEGGLDLNQHIGPINQGYKEGKK